MTAHISRFEVVRQLAEELERTDQTGLPPETAGRPVLGLSCSLLPEEIPWAMGLLPMRIRPVSEPPQNATSVLQTFCCTWVQAFFDQAMAGRFAPLWGIALPCNSCDSMQNLPDIWRMRRLKPSRLRAVRLPVLSSGEAAVTMMEAELRLWADWLGQHTGAPLDTAKLIESIELFNKLRGQLRRLQLLVSDGELAYADLFVAVIAAQVLHRGQLVERLDGWLTELDEAGPDPDVDPDGPTVLLVGGPLDRPRLVHWLQRRGALVVADDLCTSELVFDRDVDPNPDHGIAGLARRHLQRPLCPVRAGSAEARTRRILDRLDQTDAEGVVLLPHKGCEPHAYDDVLLQKTLAERSIPHIELEIDPHLGGWGPLTNRLEAFLEMLDLEGM